MADLNCTQELAPQTKSTEMTVGDVFYLKCQGSFPSVQKDKLELRLDPSDQYKLVLLETSFPSNSEVVLKVTSYKVGTHQIKAAQLVDPDHALLMTDVIFSVGSVINPQERPEAPLAIGALQLHIPMIYWLVLASVLGFLGFVGAVRLYRRNLRKRLLQELAVHDSAQTPFQQFHARMRKLQRGYLFLSGGKTNPDELKKFVEEINESYRIFIARSFKVPALQWKASLVLADLKSHHRELYKQYGNDIKKNLNEINQALKAGTTLSEQDCVQFLEIARKNVDHLEVFKKQHGGKL